MGHNIISQYIFWQFWESSKDILAGWKNFLKFGLYYFSLPLLLKTLFSPWHRYRWYYPKGFYPLEYLEVFLSNLISRVLGLILRIFLIISGILFEVFVFFAGLIVFFGWLILPFLLISGFFYGFSILF
jgi:hypothetical protein